MCTSLFYSVNRQVIYEYEKEHKVELVLCQPFFIMGRFKFIFWVIDFMQHNLRYKAAIRFQATAVNLNPLFAG